MRILTTLVMAFLTVALFSQTTILEGYIYESGNRGYITGASVTAENIDSEEIVAKTKSDKNGFFQVNVPINSKIRIYAAKDMFDIKRVETEVGTGKAFIKLEMGRAPGYTFEVTLAEKRSTSDQIIDAITGTRIEVFNNTTRLSVMDLKDHDNPEFQLNLQKGNHYTILIRKNGFLSKRMEAKVDVEGCILCFEGVGKVGPGVSDNLTEGNSFGVLLANVELERIFEGKTMEIQNLYYDLGKWNLTGSARQELNKVLTLMKDNPNLTIELGSHTDSRGNASSNMELSKKRAKSAVTYLLRKGDIAKSRVVSRGYGEDVLINNCADGVKCSESEHSINRRTELKIVGITDMKAVKSLAQMKNEEFLEAAILSLMDQKQVRAKDEEDLKRIIEADKKVAKDVARQIKGNEREEVNDIVEFKAVTEEDKREKLNTGKKSLGNQEEHVVLEDSIAVDNVNVVTEEIVIDLEEVVEKETENSLSGASHLSKHQLTDGVKAVLYQSNAPLPKDHFIFLRHQNIEIFENVDGKIFYMIGGFPNEPEAFNFINSFIKPDKKYNVGIVALIEDGVLAVVNQ